MQAGQFSTASVVGTGFSLLLRFDGEAEGEHAESSASIGKLGLGWYFRL
jgi:hypothetical protein